MENLHNVQQNIFFNIMDFMILRVSTKENSPCFELFFVVINDVSFTILVVEKKL